MTLPRCGSRPAVNEIRKSKRARDNQFALKPNYFLESPLLCVVAVLMLVVVFVVVLGAAMANIKVVQSDSVGVVNN